MRLFACIIISLLTAIGAALPIAAQEPPFPALSAAQAQQLDQILSTWEQHSQSMQRMQANFIRWQFNPKQAPAFTHATYSTGELKYMAPDKGLLKTEAIYFYGKDANGQAEYKQSPGQFGDWWVCTGTELIEFRRSVEECIVTEIPAELQGKQIYESSLPFVFNLEAEKIQERFWIRQVAAPAQRKGEIWLEAFPKQQKDAANYSKVQIGLDPSNFTPKALNVYAPNFDQTSNPVFEVYEFKSVQVNWQFLQRAAEVLFAKEFIDARPPEGWKVIRQKVPGASSQPPQVAEQAAGEQRR